MKHAVFAVGVACFVAAAAMLPTRTIAQTRPAATTRPSRVTTTAPATRATRAATTGPVIAFPTWGVELPPPQGWGRVAERDFTVMAQWIPRDGSRGAITVVVTPLLQKTTRSAAQQIADMIRGTVEDTTLDGRTARRVSGGRGGEAALFAERNGYLYEIRYQHTPPNPAELEAFRAGWRWVEIQPPFRSPALRPDLIPVLDQLVVQLPTHMRPWQVPPPPGTANFSAIDISGQRIRQSFRMEISLPDSFQGKPLNELATSVSTPLQPQFKLRNPIAWRIPEGKNDRIISQTLITPPPQDDPTAKPKSASRMAILALDNHRRVFISFFANTDRPDEQLAYMSMAESIVASILPIEAVMPRAPGAAPPAK